MVSIQSLCRPRSLAATAHGQRPDALPHPDPHPEIDANMLATNLNVLEEGIPISWSHDGHLNEAGNALLADALYRSLSRNDHGSDH